MQRLLASSPERRLNPAKVAEAGVLRNRLVEVVGFLENLSLKEASEKVGSGNSDMAHDAAELPRYGAASLLPCPVG